MNISYNQITLQIFYYTNFLLLSILVPFVILLFILLLCKSFKMNSRIAFIYALFFQMDTQGILYITNITVKYLLIISAFIFTMHVDIVFLFILILLTLISSLAYSDIKGFLFDILHNFIMVFSLVFVEYLRTYMQQVRVEDWAIFAICFLVCFLILYNTYFYLRSILKYLKRKRGSLNESMLNYREKA